MLFESIFHQVLKNGPMWTVANEWVDNARKSIIFDLVPEQSSLFRCPECESKCTLLRISNLTEKHSNFFGYTLYTITRAPVISCPTHGEKMLVVTWPEKAETVPEELACSNPSQYISKSSLLDVCYGISDPSKPVLYKYEYDVIQALKKVFSFINDIAHSKGDIYRIEINDGCIRIMANGDFKGFFLDRSVRSLPSDFAQCFPFHRAHPYVDIYLKFFSSIDRGITSDLSNLIDGVTINGGDNGTNIIENSDKICAELNKIILHARKEIKKQDSATKNWNRNFNKQCQSLSTFVNETLKMYSPVLLAEIGIGIPGGEKMHRYPLESLSLFKNVMSATISSFMNRPTIKNVTYGYRAKYTYSLGPGPMCRIIIILDGNLGLQLEDLINLFNISMDISVQKLMNNSISKPSAEREWLEAFSRVRAVASAYALISFAGELRTRLHDDVDLFVDIDRFVRVQKGVFGRVYSGSKLSK